MEESTYQRHLTRAWLVYNKIKSVECPVLNKNLIRFNAIGFKHLIRKAKRRSRHEQMLRFSLIPFAPIVISLTKVAISYRENTNSQGKLIKYWALESCVDHRNLRVIIRQAGNGVKHFYSIMEHLSKNPA